MKKNKFPPCLNTTPVVNTKKNFYKNFNTFQKVIHYVTENSLKITLHRSKPAKLSISAKANGSFEFFYLYTKELQFL